MVVEPQPPAGILTHCRQGMLTRKSLDLEVLILENWWTAVGDKQIKIPFFTYSTSYYSSLIIYQLEIDAMEGLLRQPLGITQIEIKTDLLLIFFHIISFRSDHSALPDTKIHRRVQLNWRWEKDRPRNVQTFVAICLMTNAWWWL